MSNQPEPQTPKIINPGQRQKIKEMLDQAEGEDLKACWLEVQEAIRPILDKYSSQLGYIEVYQNGRLTNSQIGVIKRPK